jgi:hypothetical protein
MSEVDAPTGDPSCCRLSRYLFSLSARRGTRTIGSTRGREANQRRNILHILRWAEARRRRVDFVLSVTRAPFSRVAVSAAARTVASASSSRGGVSAAARTVARASSSRGASNAAARTVARPPLTAARAKTKDDFHLSVKVAVALRVDLRSSSRLSGRTSFCFFIARVLQRCCSGLRPASPHRSKGENQRQSPRYLFKSCLQS